MAKKTHLKEFEREQIEYWLRLGFGVRAMARKLGRDPSVISRETHRNREPNGKYRAAEAQRKADRRRERRKGRKLEKDTALHDWIVSLVRGEGMKQGWAPRAISGRLKHQPQLVPETVQGKTISHEAIYQYIYEGQGRWEGLYHHLPRKRSCRRRMKGRKTRQQSKIPNRVPISLRPPEVESRKRIGDWETDSMLGAGKERLSAQVNRMSKKCKLHKIANGTAAETSAAVAKTVESYPEPLWGIMFQTMTYDNGTEGAEHEKLRKEYGVDTYFCDPYSSWQKGSVENLIGLIRLRFIPKKTNLSTLSDREITYIENFLDDMPRKSLNYLSPNEVEEQHQKEVLHY